MIQINTLAGIYSGSVLVARFTGSEHVGSLSLVQIGARPYSPVLGRFLSRDLGEPPANNVWRQTVFPILTFIVIGTAGQLLIADELFKVLWLLASGFVALAIWRFIDRYRKHKN
jgi:hypothetical protein